MGADTVQTRCVTWKQKKLSRAEKVGVSQPSLLHAQELWPPYPWGLDVSPHQNELGNLLEY